jgi:hypothetical protein
MIAFNGTNQYGNTSSNITLPNPIGTGGTLMGWVRMNSVTGTQGIFANGATGAFFFVQANGTDLECRLWVKNKEVTASAVLSSGTLYHMAFTWIADGARTSNEIFLNGVSQASGSNASDSPPTGQFNVGRVSTDYANVDVEDVRMYGRVLTADEIMTIYACQGNDGMYTDLYYRWLLNEGAEGATASTFEDYIDDPIYGLRPGVLYNSPTYAGSHLRTVRVA